jgi:hypothetical protein
MCILCDMDAIRDNDGLIAAVKIARLSEIIQNCAEQIGPLLDLCNGANIAGIPFIPYDNAIVGDVIGLLEHNDKRNLDKILDKEVPPIDPEVLAKFTKGK